MSNYKKSHTSEIVWDFLIYSFTIHLSFQVDNYIELNRQNYKQ
jgi:hypothetical protein